MHNMIQTIIDKKRADLIKEKKVLPFSVILSKTKDLSRMRHSNDNSFGQAILKPKHGKVALIAEVKFASPTNPNLGLSEDLLKRVKEYAEAGADAVSIITEKHYFNGRLTFVTEVKEHSNLPVLQKDFVIDEYQIYQAKQIGSDAILLIARLVDQETLAKFVSVAKQIGVDPVVEVNDAEDLKKAIATNTDIIAVNARDLDTFEINIDQACKIIESIPNQFTKLGFSGIHSRVEVEKYKQARADAVLVGTALMKAENIKEFIRGLR